MDGTSILSGATQPSEETPVSPMTLRIFTAVAICLAALGLVAAPAVAAKKPFTRDLSKEFDDLTPSEKISIRAAAKAGGSAAGGLPPIRSALRCLLGRQLAKHVMQDGRRCG